MGGARESTNEHLGLIKMELNKIYCGDAYELIKEIPDNSIDLIITDPPYQMDEHGGGGCFGNKQRPFQNEVDKLSDGISDDMLVQFVRVMKRLNLYIFCNKNQLRQHLDFFADKNIDVLVLYKSNPIPRINNKYLSDLEYCVFIRDTGVEMYNIYETSSKLYCVTANKRDKGLYEHPTIKPYNMVRNLVINSSKEGDVVLDPFAGSGTTCVAAKNLNRQFIGFEVDTKWANIASGRLNGECAGGQQTLFPY